MRDVNAKGLKGSTPLHALAGRSVIRPFDDDMNRTARALLGYGADCKNTDMRGRTPSQIAATTKLNDRSLVKLLGKASGRTLKHPR